MSASAAYGIDVLAFGAHPDDVELFCGGAMIAFADLGYRTGIVDLTRGELASQGTVDERAREAEAAAKVLGLFVRENLGLPDGFIDPRPDSPHLPIAVDALRRHRPELVLMPWIEERHPDHVAAARLLTRAVFFAGLRRFTTGTAEAAFSPRQALHYEMRHRMTPTFIVDTSNAWERKARAIACHVSQVTRRDASVTTLISSPLAVEAIEARDRYRGSEIGVRYGEALRSVQTLGLVDPLAHFRANPFTGSHAFETPR
jgi:bacillithiol biosynthesis deacetylase BshB1